MKILIGTQNRAKQGDFQRSIGYLAQEKGYDIELVFPQDYGVTDDVEETGKTFDENSELKARYYFEKTKVPTISDDGGIIIPILGEHVPGVHSKRWAGEHATDDDIIRHTLEQLQPYTSEEDRKTFFRTCLTYFDGEKLIQARGETKGHIAMEPHKDEVTVGFPYRQLFVMPNGKYYDQLTPEEHDEYNHRDEAVRKLFSKILT